MVESDLSELAKLAKQRNKMEILELRTDLISSPEKANGKSK